MSKKTKKVEEQQLKHISNVLDLVDIWRCFNPEAKRFTWRRRKPDIHCRLHVFLTRSSLSTTITNADILPGYKTDLTTQDNQLYIVRFPLGR